VRTCGLSGAINKATDLSLSVRRRDGNSDFVEKFFEFGITFKKIEGRVSVVPRNDNATLSRCMSPNAYRG
jgi:hypothetical protein